MKKKKHHLWKVTLVALVMLMMPLSSRATEAAADSEKAGEQDAVATGVETDNTPAAASEGEETQTPSQVGWLAMGEQLAQAESAGAEKATNEAPSKPQETSSADLAKAAQNPIANMISLPFQNNMNFGVGPDNKVQNVLNIQPVIPISLNENWTLITRTIVPIISQPEPVPGYGRTCGLGDIVFTGFLSPAKSGKFMWGAGPVFSFPSATDDALGTGKFSVGPAFVGLYSDGPWLFGALVQNIWSYAGDSDRDDVSAFMMQPFVNYNMPGGWYLSSSPIITANWKADSGEKWTVPIGGGVGKIIKIGKLPVNLSVQAFYNVEKPDNGPDWTLRLQMQFLFPKK